MNSPPQNSRRPRPRASDRKNRTVLYLVLGLGAILLLGCLLVGCGVGGFFLFGKKGPLGSFRNADLSEANLQKISNGLNTGMTLDQVDALIGKGSIATQSEIDFVNGRLAKFGGARIEPAPAGKTKYVWKNRGSPNTQWLFIDVDNSTRRISGMLSYSGPN